MTLDQVLDVATVVTLAITSISGVIAAVRVGIVHRIVNQDRTDMKNYQGALIRALEAKGIEVPLDQSTPQPQSDR